MTVMTISAVFVLLIIAATYLVYSVCHPLYTDFCAFFLFHSHFYYVPLVVLTSPLSR